MRALIRFRVLSFVAAATASSSAHAASDSQLWTKVNVTVKISDRWRLQEEGTARFSDGRDGFYEIEANTLLGYRFNDTLTVWAGYTHNPQYADGEFTVTEHRFREQVTADGIVKIGKGKLNARIRMEQRWRDHVDGTGWRVRPYLKYSLPIAGKTALNLSSEPFINLNTASFQARTGLDRMRNLVSLSTPLTKTLGGEVGYLNQHGFVRGGADTSDNVAYFGVGLSL